MGGALAFIPTPLVYPISVISGIGPLWFAQMLFVFSCLLVLLRRLGWAEKWREQCENLPSAVFVLLFLPLWGAAQVLNLPVLTMYRFGIYLAAFLIGYLVLSHEAAQEALARFGLPLLAAAAAGAGKGLHRAGVPAERFDQPLRLDGRPGGPRLRPAVF